MRIGSTKSLRKLLSNADLSLIKIISDIINPQAKYISSVFYKEMMRNEESQRFLSHKLVEERLQAAMTEWTISLFEPKQQEEITAFIDRQAFIGDRHARINIPFHVLQAGISELKREIFRQLVHSPIKRKVLSEALIFAGELIDLSTAVMNHAYFFDMMKDDRERQVLQFNSMGVDLALQTEGLRASLFDWHRSILGLLLQTQSSAQQIPSIRKTHFGLWVFHKGDLLFPDSVEISTLKGIVKEIHTYFEQIFQHRKGANEPLEIYSLLRKIDDSVTSATEILSIITERTLALENGKDSLTKLLNRRYLRTVLQKEVNISSTTNERFGLLLIDIDFFKKINDVYGHDGGDLVLKYVAETLINTVRAGDFVFRYGGEEFLVLLSSIDAEQLDTIANKILEQFRSHPAYINKENKVNVSVSIGAALHDGHPDFENLINKADAMLYEAKNTGRDRLCIAT